MLCVASLVCLLSLVRAGRCLMGVACFLFNFWMLEWWCFNSQLAFHACYLWQAEKCCRGSYYGCYFDNLQHHIALHHDSPCSDDRQLGGGNNVRCLQSASSFYLYGYLFKVSTNPWWVVLSTCADNATSCFGSGIKPASTSSVVSFSVSLFFRFLFSKPVGFFLCFFHDLYTKFHPFNERLKVVFQGVVKKAIFVCLNIVFQKPSLFAVRLKFCPFSSLPSPQSCSVIITLSSMFRNSRVFTVFHEC